MSEDKLPKTKEEFLEFILESNINVMSENTPIMFYAGEELEEGKGGERVYVAKFEKFTITVGLKQEMLGEISMAMSQNFKTPFVILLPEKMLDKKPLNFTYPIVFLGHRIFIVPEITKIMVYEDE